MGDGLVVDGRRPAVARVATLPRSYRLTEAEWRVLMVLACDSYDGEISAPGLDNLARWTGMLRGSVAAAITRLCEPSEHRPPLLERIYSSPGRHRTEYGLLLPRDEEEALELAARLSRVTEPSGELSANRPAPPDGKPSSEPSSEPSSATGPPYIPLSSLQASSLSPAAQPAPGAARDDDLTSDVEPDDDDELMHARRTLDALSPERWDAEMRWAAQRLGSRAPRRDREIAAAHHLEEISA